MGGFSTATAEEYNTLSASCVNYSDGRIDIVCDGECGFASFDDALYLKMRAQLEEAMLLASQMGSSEFIDAVLAVMHSRTNLDPEDSAERSCIPTRTIGHAVIQSISLPVQSTITTSVVVSNCIYRGTLAFQFAVPLGPSDPNTLYVWYEGQGAHIGCLQ